MVSGELLLINGGQMERKDLLNKTEIKSRGWTKGLMNKFLPEPIKSVINMFYKSGPLIDLFSLEQIVQIEASTEFLAAQEVASKRSLSAKQAAKTKEAATLKWADELPAPQIPIYPKEELYLCAAKHYEEFHEYRSRHRSDYDDLIKKVDVESAPEDFLQRIAVNFLRHDQSPYEERLSDTFRLVGGREAKLIIYEKILDAIAEAYPWLSDECNRQFRKKANLFDLY